MTAPRIKVMIVGVRGRERVGVVLQDRLQAAQRRGLAGLVVEIKER